MLKTLRQQMRNAPTGINQQSRPINYWQNRQQRSAGLPNKARVQPKPPLTLRDLLGKREPVTVKENIYVFMHVATLGPWENIVADQIEELEASGMAPSIKEFYVGAVGSPQPLPIKLPHTLLGWETIDKAEMFTLRHMQRIAKDIDGKIMYIHSKCVSHADNTCHCWRKFMEYFVIWRWLDCLDVLNSYDACGVEWRPPLHVYDSKIFEENGVGPVAHFSGNFWWANTSTIRRIPDDALDKCGNRWAAEVNFIQQAKPKVQCFHRLYECLTKKRVPVELLIPEWETIPHGEWMKRF